MLRYRCLVLDHDDTVVRSTDTVNYPAFLEALDVLRTGQTISFQEFMNWCFEKGFFALCKEKFCLNVEERELQFDMWKNYVRSHVPQPYDGIAQLLERFRAQGGIVCVSSHSGAENITRDYHVHFGIAPDQIFGWELGEEHRKPAPFALKEIMRQYCLTPADLLMVDDLKPGYDMARACGVQFACAGWSHQYQNIIDFMRKNSDVYLETTAELENFVFDRKKS